MQTGSDYLFFFSLSGWLSNVNEFGALYFLPKAVYLNVCINPSILAQVEIDTRSIISGEQLVLVRSCSSSKSFALLKQTKKEQSALLFNYN